MRTLAIVLIICSSFVFSGCFSLNPKVKWEMPEKPKLETVSFTEFEGGYEITREDAKKLADNIDELKFYTYKLEVLVGMMKKYYE